MRDHGEADLRALLEVAQASEVTVRRDLRALEERGLVVRRRGGVVLPEPVAPGRGLEDDGGTAPEAREIATLAAHLVREGDTVAIGAGPISRLLATAVLDVPRLTVVTNSLLVGEALAPGASVTVVMTGGSLRGASYGFVGSSAEQALAELKVRLAFLAGDGVTAGWGLSRSDLTEVGIDRTIAEAATSIVALVEGQALGVDAPFQTVPAARIGHLVTATPAAPEVLDPFRAIGIDVLVAPPPEK